MAAGAHERAEAFEPDVGNVAAARRFLRTSLESFAVPEPPSEDAFLLGNELVTNAVQHARTRLEVCVSANAVRVRIEVRDSHPAPARPRSAGTAEPSGRGLAMIDLVAERWGVDETATGKAVWAELLV